MLGLRCASAGLVWSVLVGCGGWGLMAVWNSGFVSPGLCSGMSLRWMYLYSKHVEQLIVK